MKLLIITFCALLELSISIPLENKSFEAYTFSHSNKIFFQTLHENRTSLPNKHHEIPLLANDEQQYFFLSDLYGNVIITDSGLNEVISYNLPEISYCITAIVNHTFYSINTLNGTILSTALENLLQGPNNIDWTLDGVFPKEAIYIRSNPAVNGSNIYFVTFDGMVYFYDTESKITYKIGIVEKNDNYASLVIVENVLYILKYVHFFSFNGTSISQITVPSEATKNRAGLFQQGNNVCLVGGNSTDVNPDPVYCYNPSNKQWSIPSYINIARWYPGVVTVGLRTYIFGGEAHGSSESWLDSVEVLNHETNLWGFVRSPLTEGQQFIQALVFNL